MIVGRNKPQTIAESVAISKITFQHILSKDHDLYRMCQHVFLSVYTEDEKAFRMKIEGHLISTVDKHSLFGEIGIEDAK